LPASYIDWLERFDKIEIGTTFLFGLSEQTGLRKQQSDYITRGWLNIANDGCGNYYALVLSNEFGLDGPVIFVDSHLDESDVYIVASSFQMFMAGLLIQEQGEFDWPFDKEKSCELDPLLNEAKNIRMPWDS
jgi:hypothetical protein